ncbi:alpha/beta hydrolase [Sunxiuqinia indica]|uniref:alpha/beta hydrolase n=1 Tax=Sunxiuqinia indica TaxID=2692584 RepID=UPI0013599348|nr:alpha/beta hydrolase [Sunxiuqinia indica]
MKILLLTLLIFSLASVGIAQERYLEQITDSVKTDTYTYAQKDGEELDLDIYTPAFDSELERPVIIYVHGGGFSGGTRNGKNTIAFCKRIAERGFVVVSMSYRLTRKGTETAFGCDCPANEKLSTIASAVEDVQDATFFLIQNRETFGIDPQNIILAGSSAGAETVLATAYEPPYCYGLDSGPVSYAGVVSMAGAIADTARIYDESAVPSLLFHGTCDNLVPYATAPHHYCDESKAGYLILHGAKTIANKLHQLNKPYWLYTFCGGNHSVAGSPMTNQLEEIMTFCYNFVLHGSKDQIHTVVPGEHNCDYPAFGFCNE